MRSIRSRVSSLALTDERGAAVAEFTMIAILLTTLFFVVLQVGIYLYQRSVVASSALAGARYAANANVDLGEGGARASALIADSLSTSTAAAVHCTAEQRQGDDGLELVVVSCSGELPTMVTAFGALLPISTEASAIKEGQ